MIKKTSKTTSSFLKKKQNRIYLEYINSDFDNQRSVREIHLFFKNINSFDLDIKEVSLKYVKKEILKLSGNKSSTNCLILATVLKESVEFYLPFLTKSNK